MGNEVFPSPVQLAPSASVSFRVKVARFGDGMAQVVGAGLNTREQTYTVEVLSATGSKCLGSQDYKIAKAFLDRMGGTTSFLWTPPDEPQARFLCTGYAPKEIGAGVYSLSAKFEQWFQP